MCNRYVLTKDTVKSMEVYTPKISNKILLPFESNDDNSIVESEDYVEADTILQELKERGVPFHTLQLTYVDTSMKIESSGDALLVCGDVINDLQINEITLINKDYNIYFTQYNVKEINLYGVVKTVVIFEDIPAGYYELISNIEGYQILRVNNMQLSTERMQGIIDVEQLYWGREIDLVNNNDTMLLPYYITIIDKDRNPLKGVVCSFQYKEDIPFGEFVTSEDGRIPLRFMSYQGEKIKIIIRDVYKRGDEYICEILFDDVNNSPVIVLNKDGSIEQIGENEYLGFP